MTLKTGNLNDPYRLTFSDCSSKENLGQNCMLGLPAWRQGLDSNGLLSGDGGIKPGLMCYLPQIALRGRVWR
jgi:hypothetical protein